MRISIFLLQHFNTFSRYRKKCLRESHNRLRRTIPCHHTLEELRVFLVKEVLLIEHKIFTDGCGYDLNIMYKQLDYRERVLKELEKRFLLLSIGTGVLEGNINMDMVQDIIVDYVNIV